MNTNTVESLARIILRPDGKVHIVFRDVRAVRATTKNLIKLFSDPIQFINVDSHTYEDTAFEINRKRVAIDKVLGLTLGSVTSDKQIVCDFPELFQYLFSLNSKSTEEAYLDMNNIQLETVFSDEKSFLLRYYLDFTNRLTTALEIKNNIKLRDQVQFEIVREILNTFFVETLPNPAAPPDLSTQISNLEDDGVTYHDTSKDNEMISVSEYAKLIGKSVETVRGYVRNKRLKSAVKQENGYYLIAKNDLPIDWDLRKGRKRKPSPEGKHPKRRSNGSAADVKKTIIDRDLFTNVVAPYIHTYEELDYYEKKNYHEVTWNGRHALIIDVIPEYKGPDGISNSALMKQGKPPRVPKYDEEGYVYHLHHVGQHSTSPLAVIPEQDHNGPGLSSIFHPGRPDKELHDAEFEVIKSLFWKTYIEKYEEAGSFKKIKYLNSKAKRKKPKD